MTVVILSVCNQLASQKSALGAEAVGKLITHRKTGYPQNSQPTVQFQCRIRQKCMEYAFFFYRTWRFFTVLTKLNHP